MSNVVEFPSVPVRSNGRRSFPSMIVVVAASLAMSLVTGRVAIADDATDHPVFILAGASLDRLLDHTAVVLQSNGRPTTRADVMKIFRTFDPGKADDAYLSEQSLDRWFDSTKPVGMMSFYALDMFGEEVEEAPADDDSKPDAQCGEEDEAEPTSKHDRPSKTAAAKREAAMRADDGDDEPEVETVETLDVEDSFGLAHEMMFSNTKRVVAFLPVKDFNEFLAVFKLTPISGKQNCYHSEEIDLIAIRRFGNYVVAGIDPDLIDHCPDPRGLAKSVLGKNDLVFSLQVKGFPAGIRLVAASAIKTAHDASLQKRDDEPQRDYDLRRAIGNLNRELLELAVSHIDEVNYGLRIEPEQKQLVLELDLAGPTDGKLSKFATEFTPKKSPFDSLWNPDAEMSVAVSLALPERHAKPLAAAIRNYMATSEEKDKQSYAPMVEAACKMLDSRQLDFIWTSEPNSKTPLIGLKIPGGAAFPE
jgi:hypothetical protein